MDEEIREKLEENFKLNKENNEMLKKILFFQKWTQIYRIGYWIVIILTALGAFYFIQPLLSNLFNIYSGGTSFNVGGAEDFKNLGSNTSNLLQLFLE